MGATLLTVDLGDLHHVGVVTDDLERSMSSETFAGATWTRTHDNALRQYLNGNGEVQEVVMNVCWTTRASVTLEIIQAVPGTLWEPRGHTYIHHLGYRVERFEDVCETFAQQGVLPILTWAGGPPGRPFGFAYFDVGDGVYLEPSDVNIAAKARLTEADAAQVRAMQERQDD